MEPHPVPQNIIDVEFKLFGAFSLRQFGQMLIGCMGGVIIYLIPFVPFIVKLPLIFIAVAIGLLTAFIPSFGTWIAGFTKALIIAPRYVWVKEPAINDLFSNSDTIKKVGTVKVNKVNEQRDRIDLLVDSGETDDSPEQNLLDDFLTPTGEPQVKSDYFNNLYENVFDPKTATNSSKTTVEQVLTSNVAPLQNTIPKVVQAQPKNYVKKVLTVQEILNEIEILKNKLPIAIKSNNKELESEIINLINELYQEYKVIKNSKLGEQVDTQSQIRPNMVSAKELGGKIIFGIVVTKLDKPVSKAEVTFINILNNESFTEETSTDGKFATHNKIPFGDYAIQIMHTELKFHSYKIQVTDTRLPAFKFREK